MKRNWDAVRAITCRPTQIALAACTDPKVLPRLQQAFPECFEEGEETKLPWSMIREKWREHAVKDYGPGAAEGLLHTAWGEAVEMPFMLTFGRLYDRDVYSKGGPIPQDILHQLDVLLDQSLSHFRPDNSYFTRPIVINHEGQKWIISFMSDGDGLYGQPTIEKGLLELVPASHILFDL
jgi:hypothetical protein